MKIKEGLLTSPKLYRASWVYRLSPLLATGAAIVFVWTVALCTGSFASPNSGSAMSVLELMTLLWLALGVLLCPITLGTCMFVAPEGLLYRSMGTCVYTPWKNIEDVEKKTMGLFSVEHLRLRREAVELLSLEEGIHMQIAVITKVGAVRATEEALPVLRALAILLSILSVFGGGRARYIGRGSSPPLQKYIPVGFFGLAWKEGALSTDIYRYRSIAEQQHEQKQE